MDLCFDSAANVIGLSTMLSNIYPGVKLELIEKRILEEYVSDETFDADIYYNEILSLFSEDNIEIGADEVEEISILEPEKTITAEKKFIVAPKEKNKEYVSTISNTDNKSKLNRLIYGSRDDNESMEKMFLLEGIDNIKKELEESGVFINDLPSVGETSPLRDIKWVHGFLLKKKNSNMYYETGRDIMMIGINGLISYCDGRKTSWGNRPNLIGWDTSAKRKLSNLRTELSEIIAKFFQHYEIGPVFQLVLALVPSMFLHSITSNRTIETNNEDALSSLNDLM